jgi:mannose-6-phosphate isomerase-like protein (cupin superfamily)
MREAKTMQWTARQWTASLPEDFVTAPDGSEIRPMLELSRGGLSHCTLPPGAVSLAVRHKTIEELWYVLGGTGQIWRKLDAREEVVEVTPGTSVSIPTGAQFQFRNTGKDPLVLVIATIPPWPGMDEAVRVADHWPVPRADPGR